MESFERIAPHRPEPVEGLDLRDVFRAAWSRKGRILAVTIATMALTLGICFLLPKWYRATAVILPPEESDLLSNMSLAQRALTKFPAFGILEDYYTPADIFKAILSSRSLQEEIVEQFHLQSVYKKKSLEKAVKELKDNCRVKMNPDGTISISVDDRDPRRAAEMANAFLVSLDRYNVEKRNTQAQRTRLFLTKRVAETDSLLNNSEVILRKYQESHHTIAPPTANAGDVQSAADLMARKVMLEVRLGVLRSYLHEDNDQVVQTRLELEQLKNRISTLPALQTDLQRMIRDQKIQEQLYLLLTAELEQARIRESMDTPTVQILDPAVPPERHVRPRKATLSVAAGFLAFLVAIYWFGVRMEPQARPSE